MNTGNLVVFGSCLLAVAFWFFSKRIARYYDLRYLWPVFKDNSSNIDLARKGFIYHMALDKFAWGHCMKWSASDWGNFVDRYLQ